MPFINIEHITAYDFHSTACIHVTVEAIPSASGQYVVDNSLQHCGDHQGKPRYRQVGGKGFLYFAKEWRVEKWYQGENLCDTFTYNMWSVYVADTPLEVYMWHVNPEKLHGHDQSEVSIREDDCYATIVVMETYTESGE